MDNLEKIQRIARTLDKDITVEFDDDVFKIYNHFRALGDIVKTTYTKEVESITGNKEVEVDGYCAVYLKYIPATYWEPEDYEEIEVACCPTIEEATRQLVLYLLSVIIDNEIEYMGGYDEM